MGCTSTIDNRGYEPDNIDFSKVQKGQTRDQVLQALGSPSTTSTFPPLVWYYASKVTARTSFFEPKVVNQQVVSITFDDRDTVSDIKQVDTKDFKNIVPSTKTTDTTGYESGVMREIFSNFGKISSRKPTRM